MNEILKSGDNLTVICLLRIVLKAILIVYDYDNPITISAMYNCICDVTLKLDSNVYSPCKHKKNTKIIYGMGRFCKRGGSFLSIGGETPRNVR